MQQRSHACLVWRSVQWCAVSSGALRGALSHISDPTVLGYCLSPSTTSTESDTSWASIMRLSCESTNKLSCVHIYHLCIRQASCVLRQPSVALGRMPFTREERGSWVQSVRWTVSVQDGIQLKSAWSIVPGITKAPRSYGL